jgi:predicted oxidoreductase
MNEAAESRYTCRHLVIGGGISGVVTALELLDENQPVVLLDRDTQERFGGLAIWAFGGMALVGTEEQHKWKVPDTPELVLEDWIRFGELKPEDHWPLAWAECYARDCKEWVYDWVKGLGLKYMPAVNWVERGSAIKGNSLARYHILWGTGRVLVQTLIERLLTHPNRDKLTVLHRHRATGLDFEEGTVVGCHGIDEATGRPFRVSSKNVIIATGGINGAVEQVRRHWPPHWSKAPETILNGAHPFANGEIHEAAAAEGAKLSNVENMWNYAAGIPHPKPHFEGHGLSLIPCKTVLWLTPDGNEIGPAPMVTGYDTREMCRQVAVYPYTWQVLNWKIAAKELAISGAEHNPRIVNKQFIRFIYETLTGSDRFLKQVAGESAEFVTADDVPGLAAEMNRLSGEDRIDAGKLQGLVDNFDRHISDPALQDQDPRIARIKNMRKWRGDALRTCDMQPIADKKAGPLLAIRLHFISRKSLGGLQTDLRGRVLNSEGQPMPGLYAVGEAAGFGGGGASGKRSLEGTFLSGCILTARKTAAALKAGLPEGS